MPRSLRLEFPGAYHHVMARGNRRDMGVRFTSWILGRLNRGGAKVAKVRKVDSLKYLGSLRPLCGLGVSAVRALMKGRL
jgi:hypothetical protein